MFGSSCVETWLKSFPRNQKGRCPQCNSDAKKSDIRPIYPGKTLSVIDTSERERLESLVQSLKSLKSETEQKLISRDEEIKSLKDRIEKLKAELMNKEKLVEVMRSKLNPSALRNTTNTPFGAKNTPTTSSARSIRFRLVSSTKIGGGRCMATSKTLDTIAVSTESKNPLFKGHGFVRISAHDLKQSDFIHTHSKIIKEMVFKPSDALLLSASFDKTLKLSSPVNKKVVSSIELGDFGWSCCWNPLNTFICYAGLGKGVIAEYDIRKPDAPLNKFQGMSDKPVTSVQFVCPKSKSNFSNTPTGLLGCSLDKCYFYEVNGDSVLENSDFLPFNGKCLPLHFDRDSAFGLISHRPSNNNNPGSASSSVTHTLFELKKNPGSPIETDVFKVYHGGSESNYMPRSRVFMHPDSFERNAVLFAADEQNNGFLVWDTNTPDANAQVLKTDNPVLDIDLVSLDQKMRIATLTESSIFLYERV